MYKNPTQLGRPGHPPSHGGGDGDEDQQGGEHTAVSAQGGAADEPAVPPKHPQVWVIKF